MLYSYSADSIKAFDIRTRSLTFRTVKGDSLPVRHGMNLMDGKTGRIIPYEVYNDALLAELDPASGEWRRLGETSPDAVWHHHASAYRSKDHTLLLFGGYGNRRYSDRLVRYDLNRHVWDTIPLGGDRIDPRFYAAMMLTPSQDTLLSVRRQRQSRGPAGPRHEILLRFLPDRSETPDGQETLEPECTGGRPCPGQDPDT